MITINKNLLTTNNTYTGLVDVDEVDYDSVTLIDRVETWSGYTTSPKYELNWMRFKPAAPYPQYAYNSVFYGVTTSGTHVKLLQFGANNSIAMVVKSGSTIYQQNKPDAWMWMKGGAVWRNCTETYFLGSLGYKPLYSNNWNGLNFCNNNFYFRTNSGWLELWTPNGYKRTTVRVTDYKYIYNNASGTVEWRRYRPRVVSQKTVTTKHDMAIMNDSALTVVEAVDVALQQGTLTTTQIGSGLYDNFDAVKALLVSNGTITQQIADSVIIYAKHIDFVQTNTDEKTFNIKYTSPIKFTTPYINEGGLNVVTVSPISRHSKVYNSTLDSDVDTFRYSVMVVGNRDSDADIKLDYTDRIEILDALEYNISISNILG